MVHAYLMYGYPTQTIQETIDSLEMVRQLFEVGGIYNRDFGIGCHDSTQSCRFVPRTIWLKKHRKHRDIC
jgi:hypothetical protein